MNFVKKYWAAILLAVAFIFMFLTNGVPFIYSDGYCYYHVARSIVDQQSFVSKVAPEYLDYRGSVIAYFRGAYGDVCMPGAALALVPGLEVSKLFRTPQQTIYTDYFMAENGHTLLDGYMVLLTATVCGYLCLIFLYKTARLYGASAKGALLSTAAIYLSSYAIWYVFLNAAYTHTYELFAISLLLFGLAKYGNTKQKRYLFLAGLAGGYGFLTRPLLAIPVALLAVPLMRPRKLKAFLCYAAGVIPSILVWFLYNYISYGKLITSGYGEIRSENFIVSLSNFHFFDVLFSPQRGWFVYSPFFLFGVWGLLLALKPKKTRWLSITCLVTIFATALIYGFWPSWWGGGSYGARFMIICAPFTLPGILALWQWLRTRSKLFRRVVITLMTVCVLYTCLLTFIYHFTPVANLLPISDRVGNMQSGDRYTPVDLIGYQVNLITSSTSPKDYLNRFLHSMVGGNNTPIILSGIMNNVIRFDERDAAHLKLLFIRPPVATQVYDTKFNGYIRDERDQKLYKVAFRDPSVTQPFVFNNTLPLTTSDPRITLTATDNVSEALKFDLYSGVQTTTPQLHFYLKNAFNIDFRGTPINKDPTDYNRISFDP